MARKQKVQKQGQAAVGADRNREQVIDDDSSIASGDAFDSEDERRFGSFFEERERRRNDGYDVDSNDEDSEDSGGDDGSQESTDLDASEDGDGGDYMLSLLDQLDEENKERSSQTQNLDSGIATHTKESEFSASVVKNADLTLDALMGSIQDTAGFGVAQKQLKKVAQGQATSTPLARVVSDRIQRKIHYKEQCKEVSQWVDVVQQNRQAETLDFRPKERLEVTQQGLVEGFKPTTDFEKQIHEALQKAGQEDEEAIVKRERERLQDDLDANEITLEEYKKRRGELAKMRALMFYHEQKRHHIKKIKSKKYRRIRKRQRERLKEDEADLEDLEQLREKEEVERIRERASLAHKNTSKWAKRVLKRGNKVDINTRKALSESLRRGDDLLKRMKNTRNGDESSDSEGDDLVASAKAVLADIDDGKDSGTVEHRGLFQLSFMKKGIEKQKARAREEARQLLLELEADETESVGDIASENQDHKEMKKVGLSSKEEMKSVLHESELVVSSLRMGQKHQVTVQGYIPVGGEKPPDSGEVKGASQSQHIVSIEPVAVTTSSASKTTTTSPKVSALQPKQLSDSEREENPWVQHKTNERSEKKLKKADQPSKRVVDIQSAVELLAPIKDSLKVQPDDPSDLKDSSSAIASLPQSELVRRAFASVASLEEEEFEKEKAGVIEDEDPVRKKMAKETAMTGSKGWGSWAGVGAPSPGPPRTLPKRLQPPEAKIGKRVRVGDKKPNVILSEKRVKRLANTYMLSAVPYPFTSREEYEKAMAGSLGREFNVTASFKDMTRPAIISRPGKVIQPLSSKAKVRRAAAKF